MESGNGFNGPDEGFDVEVRKIAGRWYPVECRKVYESGRFVNGEIAMPVDGVRER